MKIRVGYLNTLGKEKEKENGGKKAMEENGEEKENGEEEDEEEGSREGEAMWSRCKIEIELLKGQAMNDNRPDIDLSNYDKLKEKYGIEGICESWKDLRGFGEKKLHNEFGGNGKLNSAMQGTTPKADDYVYKISCPHLMQYQMEVETEHGTEHNPEYFVFTWEVYYGGHESDEKKDPRLFGMKNVQIYHTSLTYVSTPPKPSKPLLIREGAKERKPKVCLVIVAHPGTWEIATPYEKEDNYSFPIVCLYQRMEYVRALFDGCDVDLLQLGGPGTFRDMIEERGWKYYHSGQKFELCRYIQSQRYDFGLLVTIRKNKRDAGMGYGLPGGNERLVLRAMGLACNSNFLFGDWGSAVDFAMVCNEWGNLELSGAFDRNQYQDPHLLERYHRYVHGQIPYHARPFARLVRLDRFLRTVSSKEKELTQEMIDKTWCACRRECFSRENVRATWWATKFGLLFPSDFNKWGIYAWKITPIQKIQSWVVCKYIEAQMFYWNSFELEWAKLLLSVVANLKRILVLTFWVVLISVVPYFWCHCEEYDNLW